MMSNSSSDFSQQERLTGVFIPLSGAAADEGVSIGEWLKYLRTRKWLVAVTTIATAIAATAVALLSTPVYRAEVLLAPNSEQANASLLSGFADQFGALSSVAGLDVSDDMVVEEAVATLQSRDFTLRFIRAENLMPVLFADDWDASAEDWKTDDPQDIPTEWNAFELFHNEVRSVSEESNGLLVVGVDWTDRELAAEWANKLVANLNELMRRRAIEEATANIAYLQQELQSTSIVELRTAISRLIEAEIKKAMLARARVQYSFKVIDPAVVPDADRYIRPDRLMMIVSGLIAGIILGLAIAVVLRPKTTESA